MARPLTEAELLDVRDRQHPLPDERENRMAVDILALRKALNAACDDLEQAWPYAGDYFQDKWRDKDQEAAWRALANGGA